VTLTSLSAEWYWNGGVSRAPGNESKGTQGHPFSSLKKKCSCISVKIGVKDFCKARLDSVRCRPAKHAHDNCLLDLTFPVAPCPVMHPLFTPPARLGKAQAILFVRKPKDADSFAKVGLASPEVRVKRMCLTL
jgi:hypothetical protein